MDKLKIGKTTFNVKEALKVYPNEKAFLDKYGKRNSFPRNLSAEDVYKMLTKAGGGKLQNK